MTSSKELPKGWTKHKSSSRPGHSYYFNKITGEKTWDLSDVLQSKEKEEVIRSMNDTNKKKSEKAFRCFSGEKGKSVSSSECSKLEFKHIKRLKNDKSLRVEKKDNVSKKKNCSKSTECNNVKETTVHKEEFSLGECDNLDELMDWEPVNIEEVLRESQKVRTLLGGNLDDNYERDESFDTEKKLGGISIYQ